MGGRGRGTSSFTPDQLHALGVPTLTKDSQMSAGPPPLFPSLFVKPARLKSNSDMDYKILWKDEFFMYLRESSYYQSNEPTTRKPTEKPNFSFKLFPAMLQPSSSKKQTAPPVAVPVKKKPKLVDVNERLKILEQKELKIKQEVRVKNEPMSDAESEDVEQDFEQEDMEMDDENDYDNNYFDNGEDFNDEDDNLDDGPIY